MEHIECSEKLTIDFIIFAIGKSLLSKIGINERDLLFVEDFENMLLY